MSWKVTSSLPHVCERMAYGGVSRALNCVSFRLFALRSLILNLALELRAKKVVGKDRRRRKRCWDAGWAEKRTALRQHHPVATQKRCAEGANGRRQGSPAKSSTASNRI
jgi:hypothetical protein